MLKATLKNAQTNRECITTTQAVEQSGLSKVYLTKLLREKKLDGFQISREWFIYTDTLEHFLSMPRKSGPKGPRKIKPTSINEDKLQHKSER